MMVWNGILTLASEAGGRPLGLQLAALLATAAAVATLFRKLRLELIPGYLLAGVLVGPHALGLVSDSKAVENISELAVILLMFGIGMHLDVGSMKKGLVSILAVGAVSTLIVIALTWAVLLPFTTAPVALVISMAVGLSSTAVLVRVVTARREARTVHARVGLGISIVQDLASVIMMALLAPIAKWQGVTPAAAPKSNGLPEWAEFLSAAGVALGGITVMLLAGRVVLPRVLKLVAQVGSAELVLVVSAAIALGAAVGTAALGFSPEMGAFLAGFLLASTPFRYQLAGQLAPMRDLLMAVFFTAVGMRVVPHSVMDHAMLVLGGGLLLVLVKTVVIGGCAWAAGMAPRSALLTGAYTNNAGEFSLVVLSAAAAAGAIAGPEQGSAIAAVIVSLVASPLLIEPAHRLAGRLVRWPFPPWAQSSPLRGGETHEPEAAGPKKHLIVIAGYGPVGRTLADRFAVRGVDYTVIELNPRTVQRHAASAHRFVYGDVTNPEVLEEAGVGHADAVILTIPDEETTLRATRAVRAMAPNAFIAARTSFLSGKFIAMQLGADVVTVEEVATAQAMEREVMAALERVLADGAGAAAETPAGQPTA